MSMFTRLLVVFAAAVGLFTLAAPALPESASVQTDRAPGLTLEAIDDTRLDRLGDVFAQRDVHVVCPSSGEWALSPVASVAWGYVRIPSGQQTGMRINALACVGAVAVANRDLSVPAWQRALGVQVLVHESYHLRRWGSAGNEAKVECQAIRHFKVAVRLLGGTPTDADELWPYALAAYWRLARLAPGYYDPSCKVHWYW